MISYRLNTHQHILNILHKTKMRIKGIIYTYKHVLCAYLTSYRIGCIENGLIIKLNNYTNHL